MIQKFNFCLPIITFVFIILLFTLPGYAESQRVLELNDQQDVYNLPQFLDILEDKTQSLTVYDVSSPEWSDQFVPNTQKNPNFGFSPSAFWARMKIMNESRQIGWILVFFNSTLQTIDQVDLYVPGELGSFRSVTKEKESIAIGQGPNASMFIVSIPPGHMKTVYLRIQDEALTLFPFYLYNRTSVPSLNRQNIMLDVMLGIIAFFFIYNLLLFFSLKDKVFLFYCGVLISELMILSLLWWPEFFPEITSWWMNRIKGVIFLTNGMLWLLVIKTFFQKTQYNSSVNRVFFAFLIVFAVLIGLYFKIPYHMMAKYSAYFLIVFSLMMLSLALLSWIKRLTATRYFSLGMLMLALSWCGLYFTMLGIFPLSYLETSTLKIFQLIVALLFFSFAMLDNYKLAENKMMQHMREADQLKDDFLANTSHELRTPLHGIIGLSEDLLAKSDGQMEPDWNESISLIIKSGKRLTRLIDDILDFSKIKRNDLNIKIKPTDFKSICSLVITLCRPMVGKKNIEIKTRFPKQLHYVMADEDRLQQIMLNLLGNAIKFTNAGEIEISAEERKDKVFISIRDTGIGMAEEKQETIFDEFTQADGSMHRVHGGTGLGLAITKKLVEFQGGTLSVQSREEAGSKFTFSLPLAAKAVSDPAETNELPDIPEVLRPEDDIYALAGVAKSKAIKQMPADNAKKILIVDDDAIGLYTLENHLLSAGYDVTAVQDGFTAWIKVQNEEWDLVVLDIMMPGMSGFDLCKNIRTLYNMTELPVIMLTARIQMEDMVQGFDSGANDYVTKPVNRQELLSRIQTSLELKQYTDLLRENEVLKDEIIKRKRAEKDLKAVNQRLIALLDIWETGIIVIDHQRTIQFFNQQAVAILGHPQHEVITRPIDSILKLPKFPSTHFQNSHSTLTATRADKTTVAIEVVVTPVDIKGDMVYAILCRDISDKSGLEKKIDITHELTLTHRKIQVLQSAFDSALAFLDHEGKQMNSALKQVESSMEEEFSRLPEKDIDRIYRGNARGIDEKCNGCLDPVNRER